MTIPAFPLEWPVGWKRAAAGHRKSATFTKYKKQLSVNDGVTRCREELARMGISDNDLVISTNVALRMDGWPRSDQAAPADPGVAIYWRDKAGATMCMAVDRYDRVADNLAAVAATLDAMRAIERHGGAEILNRAFTGFAALPGTGGSEHWSDVLGLPATAGREEIEAAYRRLRSQHHPDRGGDAETFHRVTKAYEEATA